MATDSVDRLFHIKDAIDAIHSGVGGLSADIVEENSFLLGGFRYQLLIISEATRNIPIEWQQEFGPAINWRGVRDLGNRLRHGYQDANMRLLWSIYENDLDPLEAAIDRMIAAHGSTPSRSPNS